jgi:hypothetical protein
VIPRARALRSMSHRCRLALSASEDSVSEGVNRTRPHPPARRTPGQSHRMAGHVRIAGLLPVSAGWGELGRNAGLLPIRPLTAGMELDVGLLPMRTPTADGGGYAGLLPVSPYIAAYRWVTSAELAGARRKLTETVDNVANGTARCRNSSGPAAVFPELNVKSTLRIPALVAR